MAARLGRASRAADWSWRPTWLYTPSVSVGVECRARDWTTLTGAALIASEVMKECRSEWKSATRPESSR
ncbi:MAG: hypothetical protein U0800_08475 [Isosphaeraceae bacterium]